MFRDQRMGKPVEVAKRLFSKTSVKSLSASPPPPKEPSETGPPCDTCRSWYFWFLTEILGKVRVSAPSCCYCSILLRAIKSYVPEATDEINFTAHRTQSTIDIEVYAKSTSGARIMKAQISLYGGEDGSMASYCGMGKFLPLPISLVPSISGDTASDRALALVRRWLEGCHKAHKMCRTAVEAGCLPTRVLGIGQNGTPQDIRLYETNAEKQPYVCLSHCWGDADIIRLTKENHDSLKKGIRWESLPRTFLDAVIMTYKLGVKYLWIDSLCIIQDDDDDWNREAMSMHKIYSHSYLTLAASRGATPHVGMFTSTDSHYDTRKLPFFEGIHNATEYTMRRKIQHTGLVDSFPLLNRAWVFQERILSPRVLHFGPQELEWECLEDDDCECTFSRSAKAVTWLTKSMEPKKTQRFFLPTASAEEKEKANAFAAWRKTVMDYSKLHLTHEKDVLIALAGISHCYSKVIGAPVVAGLIMKNLPSQLAWHTEDHLIFPGPSQQSSYNSREKMAPRPAAWRAPSWSWASSKCAVEFKTFYTFLPAVNLEVIEKPVTENTYGQLISAYLIATCTIAPATLSYSFPVQEGFEQYAADHVIHSRGKHISLKVNGEFVGLTCYVDYNIWADTLHHVPDGSKVYCMLLGTARVSDEGQPVEESDCFHILMEVEQIDIPGVSLPTYVRIGFAESTGLSEMRAYLGEQTNIVIL